MEYFDKETENKRNDTPPLPQKNSTKGREKKSIKETDSEDRRRRHEGGRAWSLHTQCIHTPYFTFKYVDYC